MGKVGRLATLRSERLNVQNPFLRYAREAGWTYLAPDEALRERRGDTGLVLHETLTDRLQRLNPGVVDSARADEILRRLSRITPTIEGNFEAWEFLRGLKTVFVEEELQERNIRLIDSDRAGANVFHVTDELIFSNGSHRVRLNVAFFVNVLPVLFVETKAATRLEGLAEAMDQVRRYHREGPELMALARFDRG
jgi:type I restriction enzyme, R subunit